MKKERGRLRKCKIKNLVKERECKRGSERGSKVKE